MKKYEHIFFDLDHTLWDFEKNSEETIQEIYEELKLQERIPSCKSLYLAFEKANRWVWDQFHKDLIPKEAFRSLRFEMALNELGIKDNALSLKLSEKYLQICPSKPHLLNGSIEVLKYLSDKYVLHLISNGFEEITLLKVETTLITSFFRTITTPTNSGFKKPHFLMFEYALNKANCNKNCSVMIGDDLEADVIGAKIYGMDSIYFNPNKLAHNELVTFEIQKITDLLTIL